MSRFTQIASGMTAPGSTSLIGIRNVGLGDQRLMLQFRANSPFAAKVFATLDYDFDVGTGDGFQDVTEIFGKDIQIDATQFFSEWVNGIKKTPGTPAQFTSIGTPGIFQSPVGFFPAALFVQVTSITSGDALNIRAGV